MMPASLLEVDEVYDRSDCRLIVQRAEHQHFRDFCFGLRKFERQLDSAALDEYWRPLIMRLRRYRFQVSAAPIPFNHPRVLEDLDLPLLRSEIQKCAAFYPAYATAADVLFRQVEAVTCLDENPLLEVLENVFWDAESASTGLVVKDPRLAGLVEAALSRHPWLDGVRVMVPAEMRTCHCYDQLAVIGPRRWFQDYMFTAPRAGEIHLVRFGWISDTWKPSTAFVASVSTSEGNDSASYSPLPLVHGSEELDADDVMPALDWTALADGSRHGIAHDPGAEDIEARLYLLADGKAVYLEADEDTTLTVVNWEADGDARVGRLPMREVEPGMYALLRTEGGGDYIVPVADRLMGSEAESARKMARVWKTMLRSRVRAHDAVTASIELLERGSTRANEQNVRNWMSERTIKPQDRRDFDAIMEFIGFGPRKDAYWSCMCKIESAHRMAGHRIRQLLLQRVGQADFQQLSRTGRMEFVLPDAEGGSLTAFRIDAISPGVFTVPASHLGHPISVEGTTWHE